MAPEKISDEGPEARLEEFGLELERAMLAAGRSRAEVARALEVTESAISYWVSGRREPSPPTVFRLEELLGTGRGHLSRHLGYEPPRARRRRSPGVAAAVHAATELSPESKVRLLDLYRVLVAHDLAMTALRNELVQGVRLEAAVESFVEANTGAGKSELLMRALEESLRKARAARAERGVEVPAELLEEA